MADSPVRISVELEGIEPNDRFQAACDELLAAAAELVHETSEVSGFARGTMGDEPAMVHSVELGGGPMRGGAWTDLRPGVKSWSWGAI